MDASEVRNDRELADIIKNTHKNLRDKTKKNETEEFEVWKSHVSNLFEDPIQEYALAMKQLSDEFWTNETRLKWLSDKLNLYFVESDHQRFFNRVNRRLQDDSKLRENNLVQSELFSVLDVGSCHNPLLKCLKNSEKFQLTAIDLSPACQTVLRGDFLQVPVMKNDKNVIENQEMISFAENSFDAVIFCLLLEYLPTAKLRLKAVEKAVDILKSFGLLLIVTPDSSHIGTV